MIGGSRMAFAWVLLLALTPTPGHAQDSWTAHTRPDKWNEPRAFQTPFVEAYEQRILIHHVSPSQDFGIKIFSLNNAYWFAIDPDSAPEHPSEKSVRFHVGTPDVRIRVFNERDQHIDITLKRHDPSSLITVGWVTEKLLFIRVWWGSVLGTDMVFDVERESFVYREMMNDGGIPFTQWQGQKSQLYPSQKVAVAWLDLPTAPFVSSDSNAKAVLVNQTNQLFDEIRVGCAVEREGKIHVVQGLGAVVSSGAIASPVDVFSLIRDFDGDNERLHLPARLSDCPNTARFILTAALNRRTNVDWFAEGLPWPAKH